MIVKPTSQRGWRMSKSVLSELGHSQIPAVAVTITDGGAVVIGLALKPTHRGRLSSRPLMQTLFGF